MKKSIETVYVQIPNDTGSNCPHSIHFIQQQISNYYDRKEEFCLKIFLILFCLAVILLLDFFLSGKPSVLVNIVVIPSHTQVIEQ